MPRRLLRGPPGLEYADDKTLGRALAGGRELSITILHSLAAGALPRHHADPFDRLLVAQAKLEGLTIVTRDENIGRYAVATLPA